MNWAATTFNDRFAKKGSPFDLSWRQMAQVFTHWRAAKSKDDVLLWSPTKYKDGADCRKASQVLEISCLVLDFDDGTTIDEARQVWQFVAHFGHTSWSHTNEQHKFRMVIPLKIPVPAKEWRRGWEAGKRLWDYTGVKGEFDPSCKDASRLYYLPAAREDHPRKAWVHDYDNFLELDWRSVPDKRIPRVALRPMITKGRDVEAQIRDRLANNPVARIHLGESLGGVVTDTTVKKITCPGCGRPSVWFCIEPTTRQSAGCNHQNSCGWYGQLWNL